MNDFDDPFGLHRQSVPSGRFNHEGREIRVLGQPILAWNPATNDLSVPDDDRQHSLVAGRHFYTLPHDVIDAVVAALGADRFDADLLAMERRLSAICGDHTCNVGFWQDVAIAYRKVRPLPLPSFSDEQVRDVGQNPAAVSHALRIYKERDVVPLDRFSRGYCGWLMTNRQFLDEHDALLTRHAETVRRWGTRHSATFLPAAYRVTLIPGTDPNHDPLWPKFVHDCDQFLLRWRLSGLAGPCLPIPAEPLMAGVFPAAVVQQLMDSGGVFYIPDTMPIPSRDQLRGMLDDALHSGGKPDHLAEWMEIVRAGNMARNQMDPFVRHFELQHYWRILHQRHASAVHRNVGKLEAAFAKILAVGTQQIHSDLIAVRKRLGSDWLDRPWPLDSTDRPPPTTTKPR